jgi:hypothetical protein
LPKVLLYQLLFARAQLDALFNFTPRDQPLYDHKGEEFLSSRTISNKDDGFLTRQWLSEAFVGCYCLLGSRVYLRTVA